MYGKAWKNENFPSEEKPENEMHTLSIGWQTHLIKHPKTEMAFNGCAKLIANGRTSYKK